MYTGASIANFLVGEYEAWAEDVAHNPEVGPFVLPVAPDRLHKANVSGGVPYGFWLPDAAVDRVFVAMDDMSFVPYRNTIFQNGGFAAWHSGVESARLRASLLDGLLAQ